MIFIVIPAVLGALGAITALSIKLAANEEARKDDDHRKEELVGNALQAARERESRERRSEVAEQFVRAHDLSVGSERLRRVASVGASEVIGVMECGSRYTHELQREGQLIQGLEDERTELTVLMDVIERERAR